MTTTNENLATELELDRLAWNLPTPPSDEEESRRRWPPWPFSPIPGGDEPEEGGVEQDA